MLLIDKRIVEQEEIIKVEEPVEIFTEPPVKREDPCESAEFIETYELQDPPPITLKDGNRKVEIPFKKSMF